MNQDDGRWSVQVRRLIYPADIDIYRRHYGKDEGEWCFFADHQPVEVLEFEGNLLMYGGVSCLWECLLGRGNAGAGQNLSYFNNANTFLGVGDSTTATAADQTDLQATANKVRNAMDASYPQHTDGTLVTANKTVFQATFGASAANFPWQEWAVFNGASGGRMLNRRVVSMGTKTSAGSWTLNVSVTIQ